MKSKVRKIIVEDREYSWAVSEIDWDRVLLKVWIHGVRRCPWFTTEKRFHNPWYFIGLINEENFAKFQFEPVTPKHVAAAISIVRKAYGDPAGDFKTLTLRIESDGKVKKIKNI